MESYTWFLLSKHLQWLLFGASMSVNGLLVLLVMFKSPARIGSYRYLMITFSGYCMLFSLITVLGRPTMAARGQVYIIFSKRCRGKVDKYDPIRRYLVCMYSTSIGVLMYLISVQFFYRYCVVCKQTYLKWFCGKNLLIWYVGVCFVAANWMYLVTVLAERTPEMEEVMRDTLANDFHLNIEHVELIGIQFVVCSASGNPIVNMKTVYLIVNVTILMTIFGTTTVYCAVRIYQDSKTRLASLNYDSFNNQIFYALVTQTCIPFAFMFLPISLLIIIPMFNLSPGFLVQTSAVSISTYPILDPLAVLFIVSSYRECLLVCLRPRQLPGLIVRSCETVPEYETDVL